MYKRGSLMSPCSTSSCPNSHSGPSLCVAALVVDSLDYLSPVGIVWTRRVFIHHVHCNENNYTITIMYNNKKKQNYLHLMPSIIF